MKCKSEEMRHQSNLLKGCGVQVRSPTGTTAARAPGHKASDQRVEFKVQRRGAKVAD